MFDEDILRDIILEFSNFSELYNKYVNKKGLVLTEDNIRDNIRDLISFRRIVDKSNVIEFYHNIGDDEMLPYNIDMSLYKMKLREKKLIELGL